ncbi:MAG: GumC family protein [Gemmatimonadota bacterium]
MAIEMGKTISLRDLLQILFRRKWVLLGVLGFIVGGAAAFTFSLPRIYDASSKVLIKIGISELPDSKKLIPSSSDVVSEIEVIRSNLLIKEVVQELAGAERFETEEQWSQAINAFKGALDVQPIAQTGFVEIHFKADDAAYAAKAVNTLTDQYIEKRAEIYQMSGALDFIRNQTSEADERLRAAQQQLQNYQREKDVYLLEEQKGSLVNIMASFEMQLQQTNVEIAAKQQELAGLKSSMASGGQGLYVGGQAAYDASVDAIKAKVAELETERNSLLQTFRPDSKRIQALDAEIVMTKRSLDEGTRRATDSYLQQGQIELQALVARRNTLAGRVGSAKAQIRDLEQKSYEYNRLNQAVLTNEQAYQGYLQQEEQARMSSAADQSKILDVSVAEYAAIPEDPISPKVALNMIIALAVGTILAFGSAFAREFFDTSFNEPDDVMRELELPTLASVPEFGERRSGDRRLAGLRRAGAGR